MPQRFYYLPQVGDAFLERDGIFKPVAAMEVSNKYFGWDLFCACLDFSDGSIFLFSLRLHLVGRAPVLTDCLAATLVDLDLHSTYM